MDQVAIDIASSLVSSLKDELQNLPPLSSDCCIYRAPERMRKQNGQAYTPRLVSIGPYHYNKKEDYSIMEVHKRRYLQKFLDRTGMSLENAVEFIMVQETRIRNSSEQNIELSSKEFVRMVLLDAVFAFIFICEGPEELRVENDRVFGGSSFLEEIAMDMLLLENQLPFFIFADLATLVLKEGILTQAAKLCYDTFKVFVITSNVNVSMGNINKSGIKHITDLLRSCLLPSMPMPSKDMYYCEQIVPTTTELHEAGVKFMAPRSQNRSSGLPNLLDVKFTNGVLKIPHIFVNFRTETLFRNLLAFEQCHCKKRYITEYIHFMDCLINTPKDVELLIRNKILRNNLGDNEATSTLFNNLGKGLTYKDDNYYFGTIIKDLIVYHNYPVHKWMAVLKHDYFNSPWKILSIIAALFLILFTLTQTVFSILSYENPLKN